MKPQVAGGDHRKLILHSIKQKSNTCELFDIVNFDISQLDHSTKPKHLCTNVSNS